MLTEQKLLLNQEDYLAKEKRKVLTLNLLFSFLSILFLLAEIVCSFLLNALYPTSIPLFLGLLSIFGIISAIFIFFWTLWQRQKLDGSQEKWGESTDSGLARVLLLFSIKVFFGILALTFILHLWGARGLDLYIAQNPNLSSQDYSNQWQVLSYVTTGFSFLNMMVLVYMIYACFICCGSPNTIRIVLYMAGLLQIVFGFVVLNYVKLIFQYEQDLKISRFIDFSLFVVLAVMAIITIFATVSLYYINYHRDRSEYLMLGTLLLVVLLVLLGVGGAIYRESLAIRGALDTDCKTYLADISYDDVSTYGCSPKYTEYDEQYVNCTDSEQTLVWESEIGGLTNTKKHSIGCLNMNCCHIVGDIYELNLLKLESFNIILICCIFLSVSSSFFLTNKYSGERSLKRALEYVFIITLVLLFVLGFASMFLFQLKLPEQRTLISVDSSKFSKSSDKVNYTENTQYVATTSCSLIKSYTPTYNLTATLGQSKNLNETGVRTIVIVSNAQLWYDNNYSFIDIQMFDTDLKNQLFPDVDFSDADLLIFQGNATKMQKFVDEKLYLCPVSVLSTIYLEYYTSTVNLTNNTADNTTLNWTFGSNTGSYLETSTKETSHKSARLNNETESLSNTTNLTELQTGLSQLSFGELTINTYSISQEAALSNVSLKIYSNYLSSCTEPTSSPIFELYSDDSGVLNVSNLAYGKYTVIGSKSSAKSNCLQVTINQPKLSTSLFLIESLEVNEISVLLEWTGSLDLNLFGAFQLSSSENCVVGYYNEECTGLSFKKLNSGNSQAQLVEIDVLGEYSYLFFVKRELTWNEYQSRINTTNLNTDFLTAEFKIKAFVHELEYPATMISYTGSTRNESLVNVTNLAYLGYCVEGEKSDILKKKETFWTGNETLPKASKIFFRMQAKIPRKINSLNEILDKYRCFFFDMDGVLWRGDETVPHALEFLRYLEKNNKKIYFFTNNSSVSRKGYLSKLSKYGYIPNYDNIFCASYILTSYMKKNYPQIKKVYVVGMEGLVEEFETAGYQVVDSKIHDGESFRSAIPYGSFPIDKDIQAVVSGVDYAFNYYKLWYATSCIYVNNAVYFATNEDPNIKLGYYKIPGAGTMAAAIARSSETAPINTGKPNPISINLVCERDGLDKNECLMIGDSLYTDIPFANNAGIDGLLVLTGVTNQEEYEKMSKDPNFSAPTYFAEDLRVFI